MALKNDPNSKSHQKDNVTKIEAKADDSLRKMLGEDGLKLSSWGEKPIDTRRSLHDTSYSIDREELSARQHPLDQLEIEWIPLMDDSASEHEWETE